MSILERFSKWLQLKVYQFEVTFSVYMFTPMEKLFFCTYLFSSSCSSPPSNLQVKLITRFFPSKTGSVLFLLFSLTFLASVLYLPQHIAFLLQRGTFYLRGENIDVVELAMDAATAATATATAATVEKIVEAVVREL